MYTPRWYQSDAEFSIFDYFQKGNTGNPVVAMPTGTGKSIVIANFIKHIYEKWPNQRIMMLTHVKELIEQNAEKLFNVWPTCPLGIHSAGLNAREFAMPIIFGGIQSVAKHVEKALRDDTNHDRLKHFGHRDLILIDECHLLSPKDDSQYQFVIKELLKINPYLKVIGFTATPYRLKQGMIIDDGLFTEICYDITGYESFNRLIADGFLVPLVAKQTETEIDTSEIKIIGGEYNSKQSEQAVDKVILKACGEMIQLAYNRNAWLIFATGIKNTENVASIIQSYGFDVLPVHSKLPAKTNTDRLNAFKAGELRGLVSGQKLTTGFDHPPIDFIGDLNPTISPGKHVQKYGRGTRPSPSTGKVNCLIGDFARNIKTLGPINDPRIPSRGGKRKGEAPIKICESCGFYNHASARFCENCGFEFKFETKVFATAGTLEPLRTDSPTIKFFDVDKVIYNLHEKRNKNNVLISPPMIKVSYFCGLQMFQEFVMLEHSGFAAKKSKDWWKVRHKEDPPITTYEALKRVSELKTPKMIKVRLDNEYPEILDCEW